MLVVTNAFKSITRSKGRNILIGIIVLTIAISSSVALSIRKAAEDARQSGLDAVNITASISINRQNLMENIQRSEGEPPDMSNMRDMMSQIQELSLSELQRYAQSDFVKSFYYTQTASFCASGDLEPYGTTSDAVQNQFSIGGPGKDGGFSMGDFTVTGYSSEEAMTKFINGTAKITDGQMFAFTSLEQSCLISNELAVFNGLSVGDTITLANPSDEAETYVLTVVGIYADSSSSDTGGQMKFSNAQDAANLICVSSSVLQNIVEQSSMQSQTAGTYVFADKEAYDHFEATLSEQGLSDDYSLVSMDISNYENSLVPLENLSSFATTMLWIILGIGAVILIVINIFNIRERKYEVGVLTAIGIKKWKVTMQFVAELLCVVLVCMIIGAGIGAAASVPVSNALLSSQVEQQQAQTLTQNENFGRPNGGGFPGGDMQEKPTEREAYLDKINATMDFTILLQLIGIGIILTILSSFVAVVFVLRYEPLKILANRA